MNNCLNLIAIDNIVWTSLWYVTQLQNYCSIYHYLNITEVYIAIWTLLMYVSQSEPKWSMCHNLNLINVSWSEPYWSMCHNLNLIEVCVTIWTLLKYVSQSELYWGMCRNLKFIEVCVAIWPLLKYVPQSEPYWSMSWTELYWSMCHNLNLIEVGVTIWTLLKYASGSELYWSMYQDLNFSSGRYGFIHLPSECNEPDRISDLALRFLIPSLYQLHHPHIHVWPRTLTVISSPTCGLLSFLILISYVWGVNKKEIKKKQGLSVGCHWEHDGNHECKLPHLVMQSLMNLHWG